MNQGLTGLFDLLFWPVSRLSPLPALAIFSVLTGILMLWIFGLVSDQKQIRTIRDRIRGNLIAVRLFGDDLGLLFRLQRRLLWDNVVFLKHAAIPVVIMLLPVLLILVQLNLRFGASPLAPGETALVKVTLRDAAAIERGVVLETPDTVIVETDAVRIPALREVAWRIRPQQAGDYRLLVRVGDERVEKLLRVGHAWGAVSTVRTGKNLLDVLQYPGEPPIGSGPVESIEIQYRELSLELFGWSVHWVILFFVLSILSGFAFRGVLGVEI